MELTRIKNTSIRETIDKIYNRSIILPALQREFVWKRKDIIRLFDSLLQGYPINTMMFWEVDNIYQQKMEFYEFINCDYQEGKYNHKYNVANNKNVTIVIDGQQRLTSLYIAIYGSYRTENGKNKQYLFLNLDKTSPENDDDNNKYLLKFLTEKDAQNKQKGGEHWVKVRDVYLDLFNLNEYCKQHGLKRESKRILTKLYKLFKDDTKCLNYYLIKENSIDDVLEVFVRTNNGGKPISKGDLLLSMITVQWAQKDNNAREYVEGIIKEVAERYGYKLDKNWVLGCILYILDGDVKLSVDSFTPKISQAIFDKQKQIEESILMTCELIKLFHIHERGLTSKLALFPIVYHIYHYKPGICKPKGGIPFTVKGDIKSIRTWLFRSTLMGFFAGQTYEKLSKIRDIQQSNTVFPIKEIINLRTSQGDNYLRLTNIFYEELLKTKKKDSFSLLNIIFSEHIDLSESYDIDHIHPKNDFKDKGSFKYDYDTLPNLQLLTGPQNKNKNKRTLIGWIKDMVKHHQDKLDEMFLPTRNNNIEAYYDISNFDAFYEKRRKSLFKAIKKMLDDTLPLN